MEINNPAYTQTVSSKCSEGNCWAGLFQKTATVANNGVERLLPTREILLQVTSYLDFYLLRVHFVLRPALRILDAKIYFIKLNIIS
jgi:hypothetical protein